MGWLTRLLGIGGGEATTVRPEAMVARRPNSRDRWLDSPAVLTLLKSFVNGGKPEYLRAEQWDAVLPSNLKETFKRLTSQGVLVPADLSQTAHAFINAAKGKELARARGLKTSGSKREVIERLLAADMDGMKALLAGERFLACSSEARTLVEAFVLQAANARQVMETEALAFVQAHQFTAAADRVARYEGNQVFPRGVNADWKGSQKGAARLLESIFKVRPKILKELADDEREHICVAAAMMSLLGYNTARQWLPSDLKGVSRFDNDTAARMQFFAAQEACTQRERGATYEVIASNDSCAACKALAKRRLKPGEVPELPFEHCAHEMGCRCILSVAKLR